MGADQHVTIDVLNFVDRCIDYMFLYFSCAQHVDVMCCVSRTFVVFDEYIFDD